MILTMRCFESLRIELTYMTMFRTLRKSLSPRIRRQRHSSPQLDTTARIEDGTVTVGVRNRASSEVLALTEGLTWGPISPFPREHAFGHWPAQLESSGTQKETVENGEIIYSLIICGMTEKITHSSMRISSHS